MSDLVSEDHVLARIAAHFPNEGPDVLLGRGDDCAVLGVGGPLCVSTDLFMEDVHFRRAYFTPGDIGWKALAVNLSDLAASGARPVSFTVGLALPPDADMAFVDGLCAGMAELAAEAGAPLVGGDLSRSEKTHLCVTVFGQAEKTLLRGEAQAGDVIFLIGRIGLARTGLMLLEEGGRDALAAWPVPCNAHLRPLPRLKEGMRLSRLAADLIRESHDPGAGRLRRDALFDHLALHRAGADGVSPHAAGRIVHGHAFQEHDQPRLADGIAAEARQGPLACARGKGDHRAPLVQHQGKEGVEQPKRGEKIDFLRFLPRLGGKLGHPALRVHAAHAEDEAVQPGMACRKGRAQAFRGRVRADVRHRAAGVRARLRKLARPIKNLGVPIRKADRRPLPRQRVGNGETEPVPPRRASHQRRLALQVVVHARTPFFGVPPRGGHPGPSVPASFPPAPRANSLCIVLYASN